MKEKNRLLQVALLLLLFSIILMGCGGTTGAGATPANTDGQPATAAPSETAAPPETADPSASAEPSESPGSLQLNIKPITPQSQADTDKGPVVIPEVKIKSSEIPDNEALKFVADMKIGWNLGNTFDANNDSVKPEDKMNLETAWCGVKTSKQIIDALKAAGFNSIRIPVSWHNHVSGDDFKIDEAWLNRVGEVVDYAVQDGMYVIINIHHDISKDFYYPSGEYLDNSTKYVKSIWSQLAAKFKDYDEHLIFESINEPRQAGTQYEWWIDINNDICRDAVESINRLNQAFVDTVRATGGNNATRYLMVPGYDAAPDNALIEQFKIPADPASNKIIISVHAYTPYNFALQGTDQGGSVSEWSMANQASTRDIDNFMGRLYDKFISKGTPVVIGEFGARDKNGNLQSRVDYAAYYIRAAKARGMTCLWWDNNAFGGTGENFGLLDRGTLIWRYQDIVTGMMRYAEPEKQ